MTIKEIFKRGEDRAGSMAAFARELGLSRPYLYKMMNGEKTPSLEVICKIAEYVGVSIGTVAKAFSEQIKDEYINNA